MKKLVKFSLILSYLDVLRKDGYAMWIKMQIAIASKEIALRWQRKDN